MTVSMYSCARCSVASFTGSWRPCACTCRGSGGQGQVTSLCLGWLGRARRHLTSFSRSFRTRSTTSTSDLSFIQVSMFCWGQDGANHPQGPPSAPGLGPPSSPAAPAPPHRLTDGLKVQGLQLLGHLLVPLPVPAVKVGGLEKPPTGGKRQSLWADPTTLHQAPQEPQDPVHHPPTCRGPASRP